MSQRFAAALIAVSLAAATPFGAAAQALHTNEAYTEEARQSAQFDIDDPLAVLEFVLGRLPERVRVFPTENYYYFRFLHNGVPYAGNLRLAATDRDKGILHISYGDEPSDWSTAIRIERRTLDAAQGVTVERVENLVYRVSFRGRSVTFALNDLSKVKPPDGLMREGEVFIGPVLDDAAVPFFLVFNPKHRIFHFLLDETGRAVDSLVPIRGNERILIGKRTGFAFYQDENRKIMIGAHGRASMLNTPYDGPFDQLPENFIEGEALRDAILTIEPELKGSVDRYGNIEGGQDRFLIHPYLLYDRPAELEVFQRCLDEVPSERRPLCFVITDEEAQKPMPRPLGLISDAQKSGAQSDAQEKGVEGQDNDPGAAGPADDVVPPSIGGNKGDKARD